VYSRGRTPSLTNTRLATAFTRFKSNGAYVKVLLVLLSILVPFAFLYGVNAKSFDQTYNGRAYYLFFVWLVVLVYAFDWKKYGSQPSNSSTKSKITFGIALILPACYVIASSFLGFNNVIVELARPYGIVTPWLNDVPLSVEFMVFAVLFAAVFFLAYRRKGLADFSLAVALLAAVGIINLLTILYPYSGNIHQAFTPFQILVPTTASFSRDVLNLMGYTAMLVNSPDNVPTLFVSNGQSYYIGNIVWPCAGIDSLIIYTVVMLLFLKKVDFPRLHKAAYFIFGAIITYFINVLRIVTIFLIGLSGTQADVVAFHGFYGQFYSTIWIVSYILIIVGTRMLWTKIRTAHMKKPAVKIGKVEELTV
jgi:thaumarchaeosortase